MKKKIKIILILIIAIIITPNVSAKSYSIEKAYFNADINPDGSSIITEDWTIKYNGDYTRFYKDIYTAVPDIEKFDNFQVLEASINNNKIKETNDPSSRPNNTYSITENGDRIVIEWFKKANNETVNYKIKYKVENLVKETDEEEAVFMYRFIGYNFNDTIKDIRATINPITTKNLRIRKYFL